MENRSSFKYLYFDASRHRGGHFSEINASVRLGQCWNELFELFEYSNSLDRIVVFGIHIRSFSGFLILFELFE